MSEINPIVNEEALRSEIRSAVINRKVNVCPMTIRLAWHASGTFDKADGSGGSNGATMRFEPESTDDANKGLNIVRDMLRPVQANHQEVSFGDLWTFAGCSVVEFMGGPRIEHQFGRVDHGDGVRCPPNGRLPDAAQGADHIRAVFYRMGFNDREIVALIGAHTIGSCHKVRSGYEGPWTRNTLKFDNEFYRNLLNLEWRKKQWDGPEQFEDVETGELMMLPADMVLRTDPEFRKYAELYAKDEQAFFRDFAEAYGKLLHLGHPQHPHPEPKAPSPQDLASFKFRAAAQHGTLDQVKQFAAQADVHQLERSSNRSALHKATLFGHDAVAAYLCNECKLNPNVQDFNGDTALHDAARFGHVSVADILIKAGTNLTLKNKDGLTALAMAQAHYQPKVADLLQEAIKSRL